MADYANRLTHQQKRADTRGNGSPSGKHVGGSTPTQQYKNRIQAKLADGSHGRSLPKLKVGSAYDGAEVEADHAAREVVHGRGVEGSAGVPVKPLAQRISRQVQRSEDEEASAKVLRSEDEEVSAKVLRSEDEEASAKVLREEDENASAKVQRSEDEEASAKVLRSEDEEVSAKVLRAEDEEASAKVLRAEDEEASAKVLRTEDEEASAKVLRSEDEEASAKVLRAEDGEASAKVMREEDEDKGVQMKATPEDHRMGFTAAESTAALLQTQKGMGEPLPAPLKAEMEAGFGADFSQVRMHTGSTSGQLNTELGAKAFTHGRDVFFGEGQFDPESDKGKELVAHELAHTVQQGEAKPLAPAGPGAKGGAEKGGSSPTPAVESPEAKTAAPEVAEVPAVTPEGAVGGEAEAASAEAGQGGEEDGEKEKGEEGGGKKVKKTRANAPKAPQTPEEDPAFQATKKQVKKTAAIQQVHPDPETKVAEMEGAAVLSEEEQAQQNDGGAHMGAMEAVAGEREPFTPETFKEQLKEQLVELEKQLPKDSDSAEEFKEEDPIGGIKENIAGTAEAEQQKIAGPLDQQAKAETPPASGLPTVAEVPLAEEPAGKAPAPIDQQAATPKPKTDEEISMEEESASLDEYMAENDVTEEQLARSNEPKFLEALDSKKEAQAQAAAAPGEYRAKENEQLGAAQAIAAEQGHAGLQGMFDARTGVFGGVLAEQGTAEKGSEDKQAEIKAKFEEIYNRTKDAVTAKLDALSDKVSELFDTEAEAAKKTFEENVEEKLDDIYGVTVIDDWLFGEDTEAIENVFVEEKATFINTMDGILDRIAVMIADELNGAMQLIADGREESKVFYEGLDESQKTLAQETYDSFNDQYTSLEETVAEKESELAQELAASYKENVDSLRAAFDEIKERVSAGWIGAALNFLVGVIKAILEIAKMLLSLLAAVVEAVGAILKDPIGFLSNLISGVKQGFELFFTNIKTHIITGLVEWLTGSLGGVGITVPTDLFSLPGIFSLVAQILGLSWDYFRNKAVKMLGEPVVKTMEGTVEVFQVIRTGGIGALWEFISGQFQDLKEMVMDAIRDMVITKVIEAGIKWIMGLMSPAGAFIKAAMMIIDIVRFFVERAAQIVELVQAFIDGIRALASGGVGAVAKAIETALAKAIPVLIGFLAALVGVTGLTGKVQKIVGRVRKRVDKAMTKLISKAAKLFRRGKKVGKDGKVKEIEKKGSEQEHDNTKAKENLERIAAHSSEVPYTKEEILYAAGGLKDKYDFKSLSVKKSGNYWVLNEKYGSKKKGKKTSQRLAAHGSSPNVVKRDADRKITFPGQVKAQMESHYNADLSNVELYEGSSAQEVDAVAYTQGNEIHFAPGQFQPETDSGQKVLAHELTHVFQQNEQIISPTKEVNGHPINDSPRLETEAQRSVNKLGSRNYPATSISFPRHAGLNPLQRMIKVHAFLKENYKERVKQEGEVVGKDQIDALASSVWDLREQVLKEMKAKNPALDVETELGKLNYDMVRSKLETLVNAPSTPSKTGPKRPENPEEEKVPMRKIFDAFYLHQPNVEDLRLYGSQDEKAPAKSDQEVKSNQNLDLARKVIGELVASDNSEIEKRLAQEAMASGKVGAGVANSLKKVYKFLRSRKRIAAADRKLLAKAFESFLNSPHSKYYPWYYDQLVEAGVGNNVLGKLQNPSPGELEANIAILHDVMDHFAAIAASTEGFSSELKEKLANIAKVPKDKQVGSIGETRAGLGDYRSTTTALLEFNEWVASARAYKMPLGAGPSMTTARMLETVNAIGGSGANRKAVAWAIFGLWNTTYYRSTSGIHTFHEVMDVAKNYGVPYTPRKYPKHAP